MTAKIKRVNFNGYIPCYCTWFLAWASSELRTDNITAIIHTAWIKFNWKREKLISGHFPPPLFLQIIYLPKRFICNFLSATLCVRHTHTKYNMKWNENGQSGFYVQLLCIFVSFFGSFLLYCSCTHDVGRYDTRQNDTQLT